MRIFIATLGTETNTFSPLPTGRKTFEETLCLREASRHTTHFAAVPVVTWRRLGEADGHTIVESLSAFAQPGGPTVRAVYEGLRDEILGDLQAAHPVDAVLLFLHGAMVAEGYDDCEGDVIRRCRAIVGPRVPIGVELDLHCHITPAMVEQATAIVTFKEYPHVDVGDRAADLYRLVVAAARGAVRPVSALYDCRMVGMFRTPAAPVRGFVDRLKAAEGRDGVLAVSFGHGFPWGDVEDVGARILAVTDGDPARASRVAEAFGREIFALREETVTAHLSPDEAIDRARQIGGGPVVLADVADNAGGGAPSDSTFVLERLVARGVRGAVVGCFWDPLAVRFCAEAGVGATFGLRVGGKCGAVSGNPLDLRVTVRNVVPRLEQTGLSGGRAAFGEAAWVEADGIDVVLTTIRSQTFAPDAFGNIGLDVRQRPVVVVKSTQHFHAAFAPIARAILYVSTPGAIPPDFAGIPYTKRRTPFWPRVADPFA
jgi:microcystin degradation protein MlrC